MRGYDKYYSKIQKDGKANQGVLEFIWMEGCSDWSLNPALAISVLWYKWNLGLLTQQQKQILGIFSAWYVL